MREKFKTHWNRNTKQNQTKIGNEENNGSQVKWMILYMIPRSRESVAGYRIICMYGTEIVWFVLALNFWERECKQQQKQTRKDGERKKNKHKIFNKNDIQINSLIRSIKRVHIRRNILTTRSGVSCVNMWGKGAGVLSIR